MIAQQLLKASPSVSSKFWKVLFSILDRPFSVPIHNMPRESKYKDRMASLGRPSRVLKCLEGNCCARPLLTKVQASNRQAMMMLVRKIGLQFFHSPGRTCHLQAVFQDHIIILFVDPEDLLH